MNCMPTALGSDSLLLHMAMEWEYNSVEGKQARKTGFLIPSAPESCQQQSVAPIS